MMKDITLKLTVTSDLEFRDVVIPDSPALRRSMRLVDMGSKLIGMRKRYFLFFKRKLTPYENMIELAKLQLEDMKNEET